MKVLKKFLIRGQHCGTVRKVFTCDNSIPYALLHFQFLSLLMAWFVEKQWKMVQVFKRPPLTWEIGMKLLTLTWLRPARCGHLGNKLAREDVSLFNLSNYLSNK